ncbi:hypothetical protein BDV38DRAFT_244688 [Aspergillus pseudotamarii]|uniref:Uncharacterized protein n=1 Tax=Aspergillus pseudotamarii TaxID=132259 RepID=A0A5N6SV03_ASPPS|nr:uncharacterized protein BDV38DRAFT_244688 [Aspergillus pseudotamarii]KAE8138452.1 hypothetical protein BDV38DRAFT_244688 [Aspergillus pseudotamarii]
MLLTVLWTRSHSAKRVQKSRQREEHSRSGRSPSHTPSATKLRSASYPSSKSH